MTPAFIGHCFDVAVPLGVGVIGLIYYPRKFAREIESGIRSEIKGKEQLKKIKFACYFAIAFGLYQMISTFFR